MSRLIIKIPFQSAGKIFFIVNVEFQNHINPFSVYKIPKLLTSLLL